mmetsp:Transcript_23066/g.60264  ORF Transcript_23066/g.60264 Transcript_23066/m.60264 type:complete len:331 (+) Transcript_23066:489-1481(+)
MVGAVGDDDGIFNPWVPRAAVVGGEGAVGSVDPRLRRPPTPRLVHVLPGGAVKRKHVVRPVAVAQVGVLCVVGHSVPRRSVRECRVLAKVAIPLPNDLAVQGGLGELLVVVSVVEELLVTLSRDLKPVRGPCAEVRAAASHEGSTSAIGVELDEAVLVFAVVLVRQVDVVLGIRHQAVAVHKRGASWGLEQVGHVLVPPLSLATDDRGGRDRLRLFYRWLCRGGLLDAPSGINVKLVPARVAAAVLGRHKCAVLLHVLHRVGERQHRGRLTRRHADDVIAGLDGLIATHDGATVVGSRCLANLGVRRCRRRRCAEGQGNDCERLDHSRVP